MAILHGGAFAFADTFNHMENVDVQTYVGLANFDFDQNLVRRYRVIIPFLASGVRFVLNPVFSAMAPDIFPGDFPTIMSFVIVNCTFLSLFGVLVYKLCISYVGDSFKGKIAAFFGVLLMLTCRWTYLIAGTALVDSLFLVAVMLFVLGIRQRNWTLLLISIYIGPWAKESFIFFLPLLIFLPQKNWFRVFIHLLFSGALVFSFRYFYDHNLGESVTASLSKDLLHFGMIPASIGRLFSFHGIYEFLSTAGIWNVFLFAALFVKGLRSKIILELKWFWIVFFGLVLWQALLSYELARMFYMLTPMYAIMISIIFYHIFSKEQLKA